MREKISEKIFEALYILCFAIRFLIDDWRRR